MEVYIEYVITDNFIIDYFLLSLALKYSKAHVNKKRIALSAVIGTIAAVLMPIFNASAAIKFFIKIALAFVMIIVAAKPKSGRGYFFFALSVSYFYDNFRRRGNAAYEFSLPRLRFFLRKQRFSAGVKPACRGNFV